MSSGGVVVYSVADPSQPRLIDSLSVGPGTYWVEAVGSLLYTGNRDGVRVVDASDVHNMRVRGFATTPEVVKSLTYRSPYVYAACWDAGVCIFESTQVGISEVENAVGGSRGLILRPNPARASVTLLGPGAMQKSITIRDVAGRVVPCAVVEREQDGDVRFDLTGISHGVYFVEVWTGETTARVKFVKQ
jgi:hypothetical protein